MIFDEVEVNLNNIKQNKYGKYEWSKYIGETINITCKGTTYIFRIKDYKNKKYTLQCQDKSFSVPCRALLDNSIATQFYACMFPYERKLITTNPWMLKYVSEDILKEHTMASKLKVEVECDCCGNKSIISLGVLAKNKKLKCVYCNDKLSSFPEKMVMGLFKVLNIKFKKEVSRYDFDWINKYKYDFYLEGYNVFIEVDGSIHKENNESKFYGRRTYEEIKATDEQKNLLCELNGFKLIRLECFKSDFQYIKNSILNSELASIINLETVDWDEVLKYCETNFMLEMCKFWKNCKDMNIVAKEFNVCIETVRKYLKLGSKIWDWCNYSVESQIKALGDNLTLCNIVGKSKPIDVYKDGEYINSYQSALYLSKVSEQELGIKLLNSRISSVANGQRNHHHGYTFKYSDKPIEYFLNKEVDDSHES